MRGAGEEARATAFSNGRRLDPQKFVDVRVAITPSGFTLHVCDQGDGFDPDRVPDPTVPERIEQPDGRGLFLIRKLVDEVRFNERGNTICMILRRA